ncbi:Scr1 family TA system antitoxin-like transcriptional regulator [Streptomyces sp. NPDC089922]|uniref:Scr1 family TA system antitoxin-like transcriptional regulator n=1 Tax=Streptomyces sp. NPDC089922 TaxID=3155189 RepID=UPI00342BFB12
MGFKIRKLRDVRGMKPGELAKALWVSQGRVDQMELGIDPPNKEMIIRLTDVLEAGDELTELYPLLRNESFKDYARPFLAKQATAKTIREYSPIIPGLLQTKGYATAIMRLGEPDSVSGVEADVERRLERQEVLEGPDAPWLWVTLSQSALDAVIGSKGIMREQLEHLLKMIEKPNIHVQIVPHGAPCIPGSISLLDQRNGERSAYTEGFGTGRFMQDAQDFERHQKIYDQLHAEALGLRQSEEIIREALRKHT